MTITFNDGTFNDRTEILPHDVECFLCQYGKKLIINLDGNKFITNLEKK